MIASHTASGFLLRILFLIPLAQGMTEFVPVNFQDQYFSILNCYIQSVLLDYRFRVKSYEQIQNEYFSKSNEETLPMARGLFSAKRMRRAWQFAERSEIARQAKASKKRKEAGARESIRQSQDDERRKQALREWNERNKPQPTRTPAEQRARIKRAIYGRDPVPRRPAQGRGGQDEVAKRAEKGLTPERDRELQRTGT